jgi:flagellar biosynthesis protein FlhA
MHVMSLEPRLEQVLTQALNNGGALEPGLADTLMQQTAAAVERQQSRDEPTVLVVQHGLRALLARFLRRQIKSLVVLSQAEIPDDRNLRVTTTIGTAP